MAPKVARTPAKKEIKEEQEDLRELVFLRELEKEKLERLQTKLAEIPENARSVTVMKVSQRKIDACNAEFYSIQQQIYRLCDAVKKDTHRTMSVEFEALYDELAETLEEWAQALAPTPLPVPAIQVPAPQQPIVIHQPLPRIIPKFDGKYENWEKFKIMFRDVVDRSDEPARIKLYHLEEALVGGAAGMLDAKTVQDGNYDHAWELLQERFEDKRRLIDSHIGGLLKVKKVSCENYTELRDLIETVVSHVENLKFLGQEFSGVSELIVIYLLANALDDDTRKLWESTVHRGDLPKYPETIQFLKDRVLVLERCKTNSDSEKEPPQRPKPPTHSFLIANTAIKSQPGLCCDFCNEPHLTFKCAAFTGLAVCQRMKKVRESKVCFNCLRAGHRAKKCRRTNSCRKCQRRHHTLLHDHYMRPANPQIEDTAVAQPASQFPRAKVSDRPAPMLQTAVINLRDDNNHLVPCRILLDNGSQFNFITNSMANRLHMKRATANVTICGIGGETTNCKETITVKLQSQRSSFTAEVECLVVPKVSEKIPPSPVNATDWPIPKGFELADPKFHTPGRIDMLVGASLYYRLLKQGHLQMWDHYPELRETHLGWIVVGGAGDTATLLEADLRGSETTAVENRLIPSK